MLAFCIKIIYKTTQRTECTISYMLLLIHNFACGCQAAFLYHIVFGNHYTCKFLFLYAQGPRASLDWIYRSVCYRTGMLPFDPLHGPVCNAAASSVF